MSSTDQLQIDTPEQIALELPLAGIGSRFLAITIDTLLQAALFVGLGLVLLILSSLGFTSRLAGVFGSFASAALVLFWFCLYWGYFAFFEAVTKGQTPGKRAAGIRVIKDSGRPINAFEAIARNLMRAVDFLPAVYGVAVVSMMISREHRRLGDFVAGTVVVHEERAGQSRPHLDRSTAAPRVPPGTICASAEELLLIETYLQRRFDLELEVRTKSAEGIAARIERRAGVARPPDQSVDDFLEAVAQATRDRARYSTPRL